MWPLLGELASYEMCLAVVLPPRVKTRWTGSKAGVHLWPTLGPCVWSHPTSPVSVSRPPPDCKWGAAKLTLPVGNSAHSRRWWAPLAKFHQQEMLNLKAFAIWPLKEGSFGGPQARPTPALLTALWKHWQESPPRRVTFSSRHMGRYNKDFSNNMSTFK